MAWRNSSSPTPANAPEPPHMGVRHFLSLLDLSGAEFRTLIARATELREERRRGLTHDFLRHKVLGMVFEKSSTRTRVAFEAAMLQCGGSAIFLSPRDTQLGRGEPIQDTARVLSRMVDIVTIRTYAHDKLESFAAHSRVPVINALTAREHPCQLLADMQTYFEQRGGIRGRTVARLRAGPTVSSPTWWPAWDRKKKSRRGDSPSRRIKSRQTSCARPKPTPCSCTASPRTAAKR